MAHNSSSEQTAVTSDNQDLKGFINKDGLDQRANCYTRPTLDNVPTKRSTFKITRVITEEGDSMDELDESHTEWTEDYSSEILDNLSRGEETPSISEDTPYPLSHATSKEKSDIHSRFRVVKIETKEPFKRGRWTCHDSLDQLPTLVNAEKSETKVNHDDGHSVCSSAGSSDSLVTDVDVSAFVEGCDSVTVQFDGEKHAGLLDGFQPIQPAVNTAINQSFILNNPLNQVSSLGYASMSCNHCSQISSMGYASDASQRQSNSTMCQINKSMSFQSINSINPIDSSVQQMTYMVPSCPQTHEIPSGIIQHGSQLLISQTDVSASNVPQVLMPHFSTGHDGQQLPVSFPSSVPMSVDINPSLIPISNPALVTTTFPTSVNLGSHQVPNPVIPKSGHCETVLATSDISSSKIIVEHSKLDLAVEQAMNDQQFNCDKHEDQDHSVLPNPETLPPSLVAAVIDLQSPPEEKSGSSSVAIDNKIEQAMDLVKSHLMFAVREEVEVLKEQIAELIERNNQLEYENGILRAAASPETLAKLAMPRQPPSSSS